MRNQYIYYSIEEPMYIPIVKTTALPYKRPRAKVTMALCKRCLLVELTSTHEVEKARRCSKLQSAATTLSCNCCSIVEQMLMAEVNFALRWNSLRMNIMVKLCEFSATTEQPGGST